MLGRRIVRGERIVRAGRRSRERPRGRPSGLHLLQRMSGPVSGVGPCSPWEVDGEKGIAMSVGAEVVCQAAISACPAPPPLSAGPPPGPPPVMPGPPPGPPPAIAAPLTTAATATRHSARRMTEPQRRRFRCGVHAVMACALLMIESSIAG